MSPDSGRGRILSQSLPMDSTKKVTLLGLSFFTWEMGTGLRTHLCCGYGHERGGEAGRSWERLWGCSNQGTSPALPSTISTLSLCPPGHRHPLSHLPALRSLAAGMSRALLSSGPAVIPLVRRLWMGKAQARSAPESSVRQGQCTCRLGVSRDHSCQGRGASCSPMCPNTHMGYNCPLLATLWAPPSVPHNPAKCSARLHLCMGTAKAGTELRLLPVTE